MSAKSSLKKAAADRSEHQRRDAERRGRLPRAGLGAAMAPTPEAEAEAVARREAWLETFPPKNAVERDLVVAGATTTTMLFRLALEIEFVRARAVSRAQAGWECDRAAEAAELGDKLARNPSRIAPRMKCSLYGAHWLASRWSELAARLRDGRDWTEPQRQLALDLLGVPDSLRDDHTLVDLTSGDPQALRAYRLSVADRELDQIRQLIDHHLADQDRTDRVLMIDHFVVATDPEVRRLESRERDLSRRMLRLLNEIRRSVAKPAPSDARPAPPPPPRPAPAVEAVPKESLDGVLKQVAARPALRDVDIDIPGVPPKLRLGLVEKLLDLDDRTGFLDPGDRLEGVALHGALNLRITPDVAPK